MKPRAAKNCPCNDAGTKLTLARYTDEDLRMARIALKVESSGYAANTRVRKSWISPTAPVTASLGSPSALGFPRGRILTKVLRANGFTAESVACKNGSTPKTAWASPRRIRSGPDKGNHVQPRRAGGRA